MTTASSTTDREALDCDPLRLGTRPWGKPNTGRGGGSGAWFAWLSSDGGRMEPMGRKVVKPLVERRHWLENGHDGLAASQLG